MKKFVTLIKISLLSIMLLSQVSYAEKWKGVIKKGTNNGTSKVSNCVPPSGSSELDLNNVRALIHTGGDMWHNETPQYEIPRGSRKHSMFSASLWIGGRDINDQLRLAALKFRQQGNDFWTGPLTKDDRAFTSSNNCRIYDKHWKISRADVEKFNAFNEGTLNDPDYTIPRVIKEWPAHPIDGNPDQAFYLAPFYDINGDGVYNWEDGDYPYYDFDNSLCPKNNIGGTPEPTYGSNPNPPYAHVTEKGGILVDQILKGDMTLWWVFNDTGAPHTESQGEAIGLEIRAQAFAFATNDEINNMTFYSYEIINRSTFTLTNTYFSQWVDTDLGNEDDDYVGCDVRRGLGYCYNGKNVDGTGLFDEYEGNPPAIGVDFFQGPYMDPDNCDNPSFNGTGIAGPTIPSGPYTENDIVTNNESSLPFTFVAIVNGVRKDSTANFIVRAEAINGVNFGDGVVDNERFGMRRFVFHTNSGPNPATNDPDNAIGYYNLLRGIWLDNSNMVYGRTGHRNEGGTIPASFMFPGDTDPWNWGTNGAPTSGDWTEENSNNAPDDRRFMQSAGPFTLKPGAVNYITVGIPWAKATSGGPFASVELLRIVDDKCQTLFDNCFKVIDGPDAPKLAYQELNKEVILYISNPTGNNKNEGYNEIDPTIAEKANDTVFYDRYYRFEGYQIFQLKNASVNISDINNADLCRFVAQCDKRNFDANGNAIGKLTNYNFDERIGGNVAQLMVDGANNGIYHSFRVTEDRFAIGDRRLVNHKKYYFIAIAYAYNNFKKYSQVHGENGLDGQKKPYLAGRKMSTGGAITPITVVPHITSVEANGTVLNAAYGDQPEITRIEGNGNGGLILDLKQSSIDKIMSIGKADVAEYLPNKGPLNIKVVDPLRVKADEFTLKFLDTSNASEVNGNFRWQIISSDLQDTINSETAISVGNEQILEDLGISVNVENFAFEYTYPNAIARTPPVANIVNTQVLESTISYADETRPWLSGIRDVDGPSSANWIRSGSVSYGDDPTAEQRLLEDYYIWEDPAEGFLGSNNFWYDASQQYENVINGTWAPYALVSKNINCPGFSLESGYVRNLSDLYSVDIVLTPDRSKWSKCMVLETGDDPALSIGHARKLEPRKARSVDKDGRVVDNVADSGMGWFPGYAINLESGERLNIMFGEDSWLSSDNGADMIFNPSAREYTNLGDVRWGGKHFVYIMGHKSALTTTVGDTTYPGYDECAFIKQKFINYFSTPDNINLQNVKKTRIMSTAMWAGIPMPAPGQIGNWLSNECKIRIRVARPYKRNYTMSTSSSSPQNNNFPMYKFNTGIFATQTNNNDVAKSALDLINVVPNPYYGFSFYEENQLDNRIKIVNLPDKCTISIYSVNGTLVRQLKKDDTKFTSVEWDLKNHAGIPIAGGVYIMHIKADGIGEKTIKWFGALRPTDVNSF